MYSQAILIKKWTLTLLCLSLMACGGSKQFDLPESIKDTTPPNSEKAFPDEESSTNFEVDYNVEFVFSELMNPESLIEEKGVVLYSGKSEEGSTLELEPREASISLSIVPFDGVDLITDQIIQVPATKLLVTTLTGRFALNTNYTVKVDYPARDLIEDDLSTDDIDERNFISGPSSVDFTTEKGEWKSVLDIPNVAIELDSTIEKPLARDDNQFSPTVASNKNGDSFVFWRQEITPGMNQLWITRYNANANSKDNANEKKWALIDKNKQVCANSVCANSVQINENNATNVLEYNASINDNGQIAVIWSQASSVNGVVSIWARLYDGEKWLNVHEVSDTGFIRSGNADSPQIGIDQKGNVVCIWRESESNNSISRIKTNIYKLDDGSALMSNGQWTEAPSNIDSSAQVSSRSPKLKISEEGLAIAVWAQKDTDFYHIYSSHIRLNQKTDLDWASPKRIDFNNEIGLGHSSLPALAIDQNNDAIAIWLKHDGQRNNLWYSRFVGSWEDADYVERDRLGDAAYPTITYNHDNRALIAWIQENKSNNTKKLLVSFFDVNASSAWETQEEIASSKTLVKPVAEFDREGNAILMWQEGLVNGKVKTSYYSKLTKKWDKPKELSDLGKDVSIAPLFEDGRFLSVWESENNTEFKINSALYSD